MASVFTVICILHGGIFIREIFFVIESVMDEDMELEKFKRDRIVSLIWMLYNSVHHKCYFWNLIPLFTL